MANSQNLSVKVCAKCGIINGTKKFAFFLHKGFSKKYLCWTCIQELNGSKNALELLEKTFPKLEQKNTNFYKNKKEVKT